MQSGGADYLAKVSPDQTEIAIEIGRLVRRVRHVFKTLALEAGNPDREQRGEAPIFPRHLHFEHRSVRSACASRNLDAARSMRARRVAEDAFDEQLIGVIENFERVRLGVKP